MENFRRFSRIFFGIFCDFFGIFCDFFGISCDFFGKFSQKFLQFFSSFMISPRFFLRFFRKFLPTIRYGSTGVSPYCKFTSKFIIRFTLILIKILQSTKFEGSHFFNSLPTFTASHNLFQLLSHFRNLLRPPKAFPFAAVFSQP